jgi:YVTN family beta-propeller protein
MSGTKGSITVIDGDTNTTITIPAGICPTALAVNEVTNKIYVANFGHFSLLCGSCIDYGSVTVIDGATNSAVTITDPNAHFPQAVAVNRVTNQVYVANSFTDNVTIIDGATNSMTDVATAGRFPYDIDVNPVTNKIYVTSFYATAAGTTNTITVIDGATASAVAVMDPNAVDPLAVAVNPVTNKIYVANFGNGGLTPSGSVTVIDGATNSATNIPNPNTSNEHALAINQASDKIYVSNLTTSGRGSVTVIDGRRSSVLTVTDPNAGSLDCGGTLFRTGNVAVDAATGKVYVANACSNNVTVIDSTTNSTATIADPNAVNPTAVAVNPATDKIYVANSSGNVTVIDGGAGPTSFSLTVALAGNGKADVMSNPAGILCGTLCSASFAAGTTIVLTASSASGSTFSGWSGPCSGTSTCIITMTSSELVTATFNIALSADFSLSPTSTAPGSQNLQEMPNMA